jgi:hypothetical protein
MGTQTYVHFAIFLSFKEKFDGVMGIIMRPRMPFIICKEIGRMEKTLGAKEHKGHATDAKTTN